MEEGRKRQKRVSLPPSASLSPSAVAVGARGDNKYKFFMGEKKETDELKMRRPVARRVAHARSNSEEAEDDDDDKNGARRWPEL